MMEWYGRMFALCLGLELLCLAVSAALYFRLDIRKTLGYLTGRKARKQIRKLTGSLCFFLGLLGGCGGFPGEARAEGLEGQEPAGWRLQLQSVVNDGGFTAQDEEGRYYFGDSLEAVFLAEGVEKEAPAYLKRNGELLAEMENGAGFTDVLETGGAYVYTLETEEGELLGEELLLEAEEAAGEPSLELFYEEEPHETEKGDYFCQDPKLIGRGEDAWGVARLEYKMGGAEEPGEWRRLADYSLEPGVYAALENQSVQEALSAPELQELEDGSYTCAFRLVNVAGREVVEERTFRIDKTAPVILDDYGSGSWDPQKQRFFFKKDARLGLRIQEETFGIGGKGASGEPLVEVLGLEGAQLPDWNQEQPLGDAVLEISLPGAAGEEREYGAMVSYEDAAGNVLTPASSCIGAVEGGRYQSAGIVVDQKAPKLLEFSVSGARAWEEEGRILYGNKPDADDVRFSFVLEDREDFWNPEAVEIWIEDGEGRVAASTAPERLGGAELAAPEWTDKGALHRGELGFDGEAGKALEYRVKISYRDRAGNLMEDARKQDAGGTVEQGVFSGDAFLLDHCAPVFGISVSEAFRLTDRENQDAEGRIPFAGTTAYYGKAEGRIRLEFWVEEEHLAWEQGQPRDFLFSLNGQALPLKQWERKEGRYVHAYEIQKDGAYRLELSCKDAAGNSMRGMEGQVLGGEINAAGVYQSAELVLDTKAPVLSVSYSEQPVNVCGKRKYFDRNVNLKFRIEDQNIRYGELKDPLLALQAADIDGNLLEDTSASLAVQKLYEFGTLRMEKGVWEMELPLFTDALYDIPVQYTDLAGNQAQLSGTELCAVDKGTPETLEFSYSVGRPANYGIFGFLFSNEKMKLTVRASDRISGIRSLQYTVTEENGRQEVRKEEFAPSGSCSGEMEIPLKGTDFKGSVQVVAFDWSGNRTEKQRGHIVESPGMHERTGRASIVTHTAPSRSVGGQDYYNGDIHLTLQAEDTYSGIGRLSYRAGNTLAFEKDYAQEAGSSLEKESGREILYHYSKELVLPAALNNENEVRVELEYADHAGNTGRAETFYRIDATAPVLKIEYEGLEPARADFYAGPRTARVTVQERNFDPADVDFRIANTEGAMPRIGEWRSYGTGDETRHVCLVEFTEDGDYTFMAAFEDLAGNRAEYGRVDEFTIDRTAPVLKVAYDNHRSRNERYYNEGRTAHLEIKERNFDPALIEIKALREGEGPAPEISPWSHQGDRHMAKVAFAEDGVYTLALSGKDQAGNAMEDYGVDSFVIDQQQPSLAILGVEDQSANGGAVEVEIVCADQNCDRDSLAVLLSGFRNGILQPAGVRSDTEEGVRFQIRDFPEIPMADDLYRLEVAVKDLAGNVSERGVSFSVNRFGSVYTFEEKTDWLVGERGVYYTNQEQELVITETNADALEFCEITCSRNGELELLTEGEDYTVRSAGTKDSWKQYTYRIPEENFSREGHYSVTIYSEDRARNASDNSSKGKEISFAVDKSAPDIRISGVEENGRYRESEREITLDVQENLRLQWVEVRLGGKRFSYTGTEVEKAGGRIVLRAKSAGSWQSLQVKARDAAGNEQETAELKFLLTPNLLVQFLQFRELLVGTAAFLILLCAAGAAAFRGRKKRADCSASVFAPVFPDPVPEEGGQDSDAGSPEA